MTVGRRLARRSRYKKRPRASLLRPVMNHVRVMGLVAVVLGSVAIFFATVFGIYQAVFHLWWEQMK